MSTCFEARRDDSLYTRILKGNCLVWCRGSTNRHDAFRPTLVKDFFWWNSEYEAEDWNSLIQEHANLIFEFDRRVGFVSRTRCIQFLDVSRQRREATVESRFVRSSGALIFHRHP